MQEQNVVPCPGTDAMNNDGEEDAVHYDLRELARRPPAPWGRKIDLGLDDIKPCPTGVPEDFRPVRWP